jgi:hypothetical protein
MIGRSFTRLFAAFSVGASVLLCFGIAGGQRKAGADVAPTSPPVEVCGNALLLTSPYVTPAAGAVAVPAGDDTTVVGQSFLLTPNTTYWFAPGVHTFDGEFGQIDPQSGDIFLGAPGAILDGEGVNQSAFDTAPSDVTIEYLTVEDFVAPEGQMVVNHDGGADWTIDDNTVEDNDGAGVGVGSGDVVSNNCLTGNQEYGFSSFGGSTNVTVSNNEVSFNDGSGTGGGLYDQPGSANPNCGCAGGGKFWNTENATVTGNYVHDNGDPGIWVDTDNAGFNISNNYISNNYAEGITYEISYNFEITDNTLVDNAWGEGPNLGRFPDSAIYINASGGDGRVASNFAGQAVIEGNVLTDNWGGVVIYENANRACGLSNDDYCTLINPSVYTLSLCAANLPTATPSSNPDYYDNCQWKAQNVMVEDNTFNFIPSDIGSDCSTANWCGFNGLFSIYGSDTPYVGWVIPAALQTQNNHFADNSYSGPWSFVGFNQGDVLTQAQWTAGMTNVQGSGDNFGAEDAGSTFRIYGTDAIGTAIAVSRQEFLTDGSASAVVLARSDFFSDALAGGPLAAAMNGPLLITPGASESTSLDPRVEAEIQRVLPTGDTVYVLGGDLALSPDIDTTLEGLGYNVVREAGSDEYATAVDIAEQLGNPTTIFEATGLSFYDALSAVPATLEDHAAILLTDGSTQAPETAAYLAQFPGDTRYSIGGPLAASGADPTATRVYGQDLYSTSIAVASRFFPDASIFGVATAADFPDALGGGVFMATDGRDGPLVLVNQSAPLPVEISPYLTTLKQGTLGYVFGGPLAVGADVVAALQGAIG